MGNCGMGCGVGGWDCVGEESGMVALGGCCIITALVSMWELLPDFAFMTKVDGDVGMRNELVNEFEGYGLAITLQ